MNYNLTSTGSLIKEYLESNMHSATELSEASEVSLKTVSLMLNDKQRVSAKVANGLHKLINEISPDFIMKYDASYQKQMQEISDYLGVYSLDTLLDYFQLKKYYKNERLNKKELFEKGKGIFGDNFINMKLDPSSVSDTLCFSKAKNSFPNVSLSWVLATYYECNQKIDKPLTFNYEKFKQNFPLLKKLCGTNTSSAMFFNMKKFCEISGINFYYHESIPNSKVKGITFVDKKGHVYLFISSLFRCIENTWYTFIHECYHIKDNDFAQIDNLKKNYNVQENEVFIERSALMFILDQKESIYNTIKASSFNPDDSNNLNLIVKETQSPINMIAEAIRFLKQRYTSSLLNSFIHTY